MGVNGVVVILTPKQEAYCQNRAVKKMSQRKAYIEAYPAAKKWKMNVVDVRACELEQDSKILVRLNELRQQESDRIATEAMWTRQDAFNELKGLISKANAEIDTRHILTPATVSAIVNAVKELNNIYEVGKSSAGGGMIDDILDAVKGVDDD